MQGQYDIFTTDAGTSGFRLNYMELFNWGTFHNRIYRIAPQGNNSLLTGANASGKSTLIDALLTLLVPAKKDRFYNQSSGIEKKGDRNEETYVLGNYGNIQAEGDASVKTQQLRDKSTYSIILASFANNHKKVVTLFQVRYFVNGDLKCTYGFSYQPLTIEADLSGFNGSKGDWKKVLDKKYNSNVPKRQIEFYDFIKDYTDRFISALGLRSNKALTLFNQIVGVKVLNDLDEFIRNNMLEQRDSESEYARLNESFATLIGAKTKIEKVKEQILQLKPIDQKAKQLENIECSLVALQKKREMAVYWFANKNVELANDKLSELKGKLADLNAQFEKLNDEKNQKRDKERELANSIESDDVGKQIKELAKEIASLEKQKAYRLGRLEEYNKKVIEVGLSENPSEQMFLDNRENSRLGKNKCQTDFEATNEKLRLAKNQADSIKENIEKNISTLDALKKYKNNIPENEANIRERILQATGATTTEIPFIGELIRVKDNEKNWENTIEKILHNFALRLIVPEKYYKAVNQFVNFNNLNGRIVYQRYQETFPLKNLHNRQLSDNCLPDKLEFNTKSPYCDWVEDLIYDNYNYACVANLDEFDQYGEKVATIEGLIKSVNNKHEKDDRRHVNSRENYVLGWNNKEKIASVRNSLMDLQEQQKQNTKDIRDINAAIKAIEKRKDFFDYIFNVFSKFDDINWEEYANKIQEKTEAKADLEATNDKVKTLQEQLNVIKKELLKLENETIPAKGEEIFKIKNVDIENANKRLLNNTLLLNKMGDADVSDFETENAQWLDVNYDNIESKQNSFQSDVSQRETAMKNEKTQTRQEVATLIRQFKNPSEEITEKFKDWRSDVHTLPEAENYYLISEYQKFYNKLVKEDLVRFEEQFNNYLQETVTNKVAAFRMFFSSWDKSIKETIDMLNKSLKEIDFSTSPSTYIQLENTKRINTDVARFRNELDEAIPNIHEVNSTIDGRRHHFETKIQPLIAHLQDEAWRKKVMDVRNWFSYKAEEYYKETGQKYKTYQSMGQLSGGEKAQLTYTILGSAIAYQFGLTKDGLQANSLRFIAIDEAFKAQDEDKARYLISLCKQLHLQLLVVAPSDNIHIVQDDISFVHYVERSGNESRIFNMTIQQFKQEREKYQVDDNAN
ncbi:MAG: AAA family ATPase [Paludibacteraceae bacterium]|nr:AAA family ATPase [Paludibacteraceae bacterium]